MNKLELKKYLNTQIADCTPEKQLAEIDCIIEYINAYKQKVKAKIGKRYIYCSRCGKYYLTKSYKIEERDKRTTICVYTDCGYGDDDEYAPAIFHIKERVCPKCGNRKEIESKRIWRGESHTRYGRKGIW